MRPRADHILLLALLAAFIAGSIALYAPTVRLPEDHSVHRANPAGCRGLFEALQRVGCPVRAWRSPLTELPPEADVICIIDPTSWPLRDELEVLLAWVRAGGTLVVTPQTRPVPPHMVSASAEYACDILAELGVTLQPTGPKESVTRVSPGSGLADGVDQVVVRGGWRIDDSQLSYDVVVADESGPIVVRLEKGDGLVYVVASPDLLSNELVAREDNVIFVANLLWSGLGSGEVLFDEYHHGFHDARSARELVLETRGGWAILHLLAAALIYFFGRAWQFGRPISLSVRKRRSALEHVQAFAAVYRQAGVAHAAAGLIVQGFRRRLAARVGVPWTAPARDLAALVARNRPQEQQALTGLIEGADRAAIDADLGDAELQYIAAQLAQEERKLD